jgi:predicted Zn-dependent protease
MSEHDPMNPSAMDLLQPEFLKLAERICTATPGADRVTLYLSAEDSDFIRFNRAAVRQITRVAQRYATVAVIRGQRRAESTITLTGDLGADTEVLLAERAQLLADLPAVPEDPHLLLPDSIEGTSRHDHGAVPAATEVVDAVLGHAQGADFVGFYQGGAVVRAFADSRGQRNWHKVDSFHFDWCLYHAADKAVKTGYSGTHWDGAEFGRRVAAARERLALLARPVKTLSPGAYRTYFTPVAMTELLGTLSWGGFGLKAAKTATSTLVKLQRGETAMSPDVQLAERTAAGIAPRFSALGFVKPDATALVDGGKVAGQLVSPRSAREYGVATTGANGNESPESLSLTAGTLPEADVLKTLGTGIYVSNLWYLNYSDRQACRMTGMTRFACFWVENGELVAPLSVMRFDDSFLRMFGEGLVALTDTAELIPESGTYGSRQLASITTPGALVEGFNLVL